MEESWEKFHNQQTLLPPSLAHHGAETKAINSFKLGLKQTINSFKLAGAGTGAGSLTFFQTIWISVPILPKINIKVVSPENCTRESNWIPPHQFTPPLRVQIRIRIPIVISKAGKTNRSDLMPSTLSLYLVFPDKK